VSAADLAFVADAFRWGSNSAPLFETIMIVLVMVLACALMLVHQRRRTRRPRPVRDQWQAHAVMGELCPNGWQAQITLYGGGAPVPDEAASARGPLVELEWRQFDETPRRVVAARRVWAPTIGDALQTMVEDRRTDITLEQIERSAAERSDVR